MTDTSERHVIDFDHHSPRFRDQTRGVVAELHASGCPLGFSEHHGGYWAILRAEAVAHRTYLAAPHNITMRELAEVVCQLVPRGVLDFPTPERRPSYAKGFDSGRAITEFAWQPLTFTESVRRYIDAVRADDVLR